MTGNDKLLAEEQKYRIYVEQSCRCFTCGFPVPWSMAEAAHRIPKTKPYLKKYGAKVIHHRQNIAVTHPGKCNSSVLMDPKTHPIEAAKLVAAIKKELNNDL